jgi:hypothetical protein
MQNLNHAQHNRKKNKVLTRTHTTQLHSSPTCFTPQYIAYRPQGSTGITSTCKITVRVNIIVDTALAELTVADTTQQFALHICSCSLPFRDVPSIPGTGTSCSVCNCIHTSSEVNRASVLMGKAICAT